MLKTTSAEYAQQCDYARSLVRAYYHILTVGCGAPRGKCCNWQCASHRIAKSISPTEAVIQSIGLALYQPMVLCTANSTNHSTNMNSILQQQSSQPRQQQQPLSANPKDSSHAAPQEEFPEKPEVDDDDEDQLEDHEEEQGHEDDDDKDRKILKSFYDTLCSPRRRLSSAMQLDSSLNLSDSSVSSVSSSSQQPLQSQHQQQQLTSSLSIPKRKLVSALANANANTTLQRN